MLLEQKLQWFSVTENFFFGDKFSLPTGQLLPLDLKKLTCRQ